MKYTDIIIGFLNKLGINEVDELKNIPIDIAFKKYIEYYKETEIEDLVSDDMDDAILFQWGTYNWGDGKNTEIDLTRQIILDDKSLDDDDRIVQIRLVYKYEPNQELEELGMSNMWFEDKSYVDDIYDEFNDTRVIDTAMKYKVKNVEFIMGTV